MFSSLAKNSLTLIILVLIAILVLVEMATFTKEHITKSEREAKAKELFEIAPNNSHDNDMLTETISIPKAAWAGLGLKSGGDIYVARRADETLTVIIPAVAPDGYHGEIRMIVGVNADGTIAGVRILDHHETPGLGDKIDLDKSPWLLSFSGKSSESPNLDHWKIKKDGGDFDQFAGATVTPRAVVNQVRRVLEFVDAHRNELFTKNPSPKPVGANNIRP